MDRRAPLVGGLCFSFLAGCSGTYVPPPPPPEPVEREPIEFLRCEVGWRCYAIDPETQERTELLDSGTAWYETAAERLESRVCRSAQAQAESADCREGSPYFEQLEIDRNCSCTRELR